MPKNKQTNKHGGGGGGFPVKSNILKVLLVIKIWGFSPCSGCCVFLSSIFFLFCLSKSEDFHFTNPIVQSPLRSVIPQKPATAWVRWSSDITAAPPPHAQLPISRRKPWGWKTALDGCRGYCGPLSRLLRLGRVWGSAHKDPVGRSVLLALLW